MRPSRIKKAALTEVPIIPPTVLKLSKRDDTAAAVAATTIEVIMTILLFVRHAPWGLLRLDRHAGVDLLTLSGPKRRMCPL